MNIRKVWMALLIALSLGLLMSAASAQTVTIADGSADAGATTTVTITADDVTDLANFDITVTYDPAVVIVIGAANDAAFGSAVNNLENAASGSVRLASLNLGAGQTGDGILISTLILEATGTAGQTSALTLTIDELKDSTEADITATMDGGVFTVAGEAPAGPVVSISDGSADAGATTTVTITADDVTDLANFDITVTYDPAVVIVTDAANDAAFGSAVNNLENAASGSVRLASLNLGAGQTGDGILISTLTLEATGTAGQTSALTLTIDELKDSTEADITATTDGGVFTVSAAAPTLASITISPTSCDLGVGGTQTFTAVCTGTDGSVMTPTLEWTSTDTAVGTITSAGVFTASAAGTADITASAEGKTSNTATVTVEPAVTIAIKAGDGSDLPDSIPVDETFTVLITEDGSPVGAGTNVTFTLPYGTGNPVYCSTDVDGKVNYMPLNTGTLGIRVLEGTVPVANATVDVVTEIPPSGGRGGGGGRGGTYPPGWGTTTTTATVTATAAPSPGATPGATPPELAPTPTKTAVAEETPSAVAEETPTKKPGIPGFTAVFAIAGLLAIAYAMMRRRE